LTFTIDLEVQHNCAPDFRCRGSIDANLPAWVGLEFGLPRIDVSIIRVDKVNDPAKPRTLIDPPTDLAGWIGSRPGVTVTAQTPVTVGGLAGTQLDLQTGDAGVTFGPITGVTDPGFGLGPNTLTRMIVVPVNGHQVAIVLHSEDGPLAELRAFVNSIVWN
jgi:hypothetical protein